MIREHISKLLEQSDSDSTTTRESLHAQVSKPRFEASTHALTGFVTTLLESHLEDSVGFYTRRDLVDMVEDYVTSEQLTHFSYVTFTEALRSQDFGARERDVIGVLLGKKIAMEGLEAFLGILSTLPVDQALLLTSAKDDWLPLAARDQDTEYANDEKIIETITSAFDNAHYFGVRCVGSESVSPAARPVAESPWLGQVFAYDDQYYRIYHPETRRNYFVLTTPQVAEWVDTISTHSIDDNFIASEQETKIKTMYQRL